MNLIEVVVASALFLGACGGAAQMGASSAEAMTQGRRLGLQHEQIEAQFLAAAALLHQADAAWDSDCGIAAQRLHSQLAATLPPVQAGLGRQLSMVPASAQVQLSLVSEGGLQRQRWYSPAAAGLCGPGVASGPETRDAAL